MPATADPKASVPVFLALPALLAVLLLGAAPPAEPDPPTDAERLDALFDRFLEAYLPLDPIFASSIGDRRYDDRLTLDLHPEQRAATADLFRRTLEELGGIDPEALPPRDRVHRDAFEELLELRLRGLDFPDHLLPVVPGGSLPSRMAVMGSGLGLHPFRTADDYRNFLSRIADFERWVDLAVANMRRGMEKEVVAPRSMIERALPELEGLFEGTVEESPFYRVVATLPETIPEADRRRLAEAYRRAIAERIHPAYRRLHDFLRDEYLDACRGGISLSELPGGDAWYRHLVRFYTTTEMTPEEVFELGEREIERIEGEMRELRSAFRFVGSLHDFQRRMASDRRSYLEGERAVLREFAEIRERVEAALPRLFAEVPEADFDVRPVEPFRADAAPGAFYDGPSADGSRPGTFYVNLRGRYYPRYTMEALFLHEAVPGHHFQISLAREREEIPEILRHGYFGAFIEGWGLYAEGLGEELGLYRDPYQRYGRLVYDLGRASRLVADVGIHHRGWSRKEALRYLRRRNLDWAASEIDRYVALPGQALAYKVGERRLQELRRRARQALGGAFDPRLFHRRILEDGALPLTVLEGKVERWIATREETEAVGSARGPDADDER